MSLSDFWMNIQTAARSFTPTATVDSPRHVAGRIEKIPGGVDFRLTPKAVEKFDEQDFDFLAEDERQTLKKSVSRLRELAEQVLKKGPATEQKVRQALPEFKNILKILRPDKYNDVRALVLGKKVEQRIAGNLPEWVRGLKFETDNDANGDPALWIYVEIDDSAAKKEVLSENVRSITNALREVSAEVDDSRWPYIRFRTVSEEKALEMQSKK